jgi:hypothetical protein
MAILTASTCTCGTTAAPRQTAATETVTCSSAQAANLCSTSAQEPSSCGESSLTIALTSEPANGNKESTAPSSGTRASTYRHSSFAKLTQSLMKRGLIAGITPTCVAKRSPQTTLDIAFCGPVGSDAASPKADCSCLSDCARDRDPQGGDACGSGPKD